MPVQSYRQLIAWQKAMDFGTAVYKVTRAFPKEEMYGVTSQLRRAAVSIPSNIAEGQGRQTTGEFRQFLGHARGVAAGNGNTNPLIGTPRVFGSQDN
jgi:hypothetical protein